MAAYQHTYPPKTIKSLKSHLKDEGITVSETFLVEMIAQADSHASLAKMLINAKKLTIELKMLTEILRDEL